MNRDEYKGHGIHPLLQTLVDEVSDLTKLVSLDDEIKQLNYLQWCLEKSDPQLVVVNLLDGLSGKLNNVQSSVRTLSRDLAQPDTAQALASNDKNVISLRTNLGSALNDLSYPRIQKIFSSEASSAIDDAVAYSKTAVSAIERATTANASELEAKLLGLRKKLDAEVQNLDAQKARIENLNKNNADFEAKITADANAKASTFDKLIEERRRALDEWRQSIESDGKDYLDQIQSMYRLSGDNTLSGRFLEASRIESLAYGILTFLSFMFFLGAIWALLFGTEPLERFFNVMINGPMSALLARLSLVAVFLVPAGVFSKQAGKHRRASVWYRTLGVRVATLKPYLDEFENDKADYSNELKEILKVFFVSDIKLDSDKAPSMLQLGLIERLLGRFKGS